MGKGDTWLNAVLGAAVTVVASFTVFSPVLGGGLAGYLQRESRESGAKVGALSGALATIPFVVILALILGFVLVGADAAGFGFLALFLLVPIALLWNVGLGALGGYLGTYLREETDVGGEADPLP